MFSGEIFKNQETQRDQKHDIQRNTAPSAGQNQKMLTLAERGHFKQWSASWYIASCTKFQAFMWFSHISWYESSSKIIIEKFHVHAKNSLSTADSLYP